jgi:hypothetical protein
MSAIHYIGLDVYKKTISYCIKTAAGQIVKEGTLAAERSVLRSWAEVYSNHGMVLWRQRSSAPGSTTHSSHMRNGWRWAIQRR